MSQTGSVMLKTFSAIALLLYIGNTTIAATPKPVKLPSDTFPGPFFSPTETEVEVESKKKIMPRVTPEQMLSLIEEAKGKTIKLNKDGDVLDSEAAQWDCIHHKTSGLTWEVKTKSGLRDQANTYTWIAPQAVDTTLLSWFKNDSGKCIGESRCDTSSYAETINQQHLCTFSDWRLPTRTELESLIQMDRPRHDAKINTQHFPNTLPSWYWTTDRNKKHPEHVWYVLFRNGTSISDKKESPKHIRLVRGSL